MPDKADILLLALDVGLLVLIWLVQLIIYPGFRDIDRPGFTAWHKRYTIRITYVVLPLMFGQLALSGFDFYQHRSLMPSIHLTMVVVAWVATFALAVPCHNRLANGFEDEAHQKLVATNWARTFAWSVCPVVTLVKVFA